MMDKEIKFTLHFKRDVLPKRPYLTTDLLHDIIENFGEKEVQNDGKIKLWGYSSEYNKYVRIIMLEDEETVHTAFFDRNYKLKSGE